MLNIILFGPPGSGKGTQAALLVAKYNLEHTSTGDLLRAEKSAKTPLGLEAKKYMDAGNLVPDEVVIGMIRNKLDARAGEVEGFIFDGFPRTVAQAEALDALLVERDLKIDVLLSLKVSEEELVKRLLERGATSGRADDTNEGIIRNRVVEYETKTAPVADFYAEQGKLIILNGIGSIEDISEALCKEIDGLA
ncbi:MAG: adenylate kinase [Chitinophagales bacterium]